MLIMEIMKEGVWTLLVLFGCFRCRQLQPSCNSSHDEQLNSSPIRMRTGCPPRIDRSRCVFVIVVLINNVFLFMLYLNFFTFQRQVTNVPEHPIHGQVASVTRIGKLVNMLDIVACACLIP